MNGHPVEGESHSKVIELIKSNTDILRMVLVSIPPRENERLDGESASYCSEDEFEVQTVDITIPSISQKEEEAGSKSVAYYNIYLDGKFLCSHRYRGFFKLQVDLKNKFYQFEFPKFPGKWPFQLNQNQLERRQKDLEQWLIQLCSVSQLFNHFYIQDFLCLAGIKHGDKISETVSITSSNEPENADIKIFLPGSKTSICINIPTECNVKQLSDSVCKKLNIPMSYSKYFTVFKVCDSESFDVPFSLSEKPHELHVQNYNESKLIKFTFKKFIFSIELENEVAEDDVCLDILYEQAVIDLNSSIVDTTGKDIELKRTQHKTTQKEFLKVIQSCPGYNMVSFPHCACDSRKDGHVILSLSQEKISIQACTSTGERQEQIKNFSWANVNDFGSNPVEDIFHFTITKNNSDRKISLKSQHADYMLQCFNRITESTS